jgi:hypothetical protein
MKESRVTIDHHREDDDDKTEVVANERAVRIVQHDCAGLDIVVFIGRREVEQVIAALQQSLTVISEE